MKGPASSFFGFFCTFAALLFFLFAFLSRSLSRSFSNLCMTFHENYGIWEMEFSTEGKILGENGTAQYIPPIVIIVIDVSVFHRRRVDDGLAGGRGKEGI
jgi:hypothetical protein